MEHFELRSDFHDRALSVIAAMVCARPHHIVSSFYAIKSRLLDTMDYAKCVENRIGC